MLKKKYLAVALSLALTFLLVGCGGNNNTSTSNNEPVQLTADFHDTQTRDNVAFVTNTSDQTLGSVTVAVNYFKNDELIDTQTTTVLTVLPGQQLAMEVPKAQDANWNLIPYDRAEPSVTTAIWNGTNPNLTQNIKTESTQNASSFTIQSTNEGDTGIDFLKYRIVYYAGGKPIGISDATEFPKISSGQSYKKEESFPDSIETEKPLVFDAYKIYLNEAFQY